MLDDAMLMRNLTDQERLMFQSEMDARRKEPTTGVTLVPGVIGLVEAFMMPKRVRLHNYTVGGDQHQAHGAEAGIWRRADCATAGRASDTTEGRRAEGRGLGAAGGAVAGAAAVRTADVLEDAQSAEVDGIAEAAETAGEEGVASTLASLLGDE